MINKGYLLLSFLSLHAIMPNQTLETYYKYDTHTKQTTGDFTQLLQDKVLCLTHSNESALVMHHLNKPETLFIFKLADIMNISGLSTETIKTEKPLPAIVKNISNHSLTHFEIHQNDKKYLHFVKILGYTHLLKQNKANIILKISSK